MQEAEFAMDQVDCSELFRTRSDSLDEAEALHSRAALLLHRHRLHHPKRLENLPQVPILQASKQSLVSGLGIRA